MRFLVKQSDMISCCWGFEVHDMFGQMSCIDCPSASPGVASGVMLSPVKSLWNFCNQFQVAVLSMEALSGTPVTSTRWWDEPHHPDM